MIRVFHPIGQGAFYSERHKGFNIVYDCGEWKNSDKSTKLVENSFENGSEIDILFISHFDFDHISKIDILKQTYHVKVCVLPDLHDNQKIILKQFYRCLGRNGIINLIDNPYEFFDEDTKIVKVKITDGNRDDVGERSVTFEELLSGDNQQEIDSGTEIRISDWIYVPYNKDYTARNAELNALFQKGGLDIQKFQTDLDYIIENKKAIKKVYEGLTGGINTNSMFVYSGTSMQNNAVQCFTTFCHRLRWHFCGTKVGCIFTGDADLTDVKPLFRKYWNSIGTIQVPHHGSAKSFDFHFLSPDKEHFIFPASYGNANTYGHPAQSVICNIEKNGSCFVHVTENQETGFIQYIEQY